MAVLSRRFENAGVRYPGARCSLTLCLFPSLSLSLSLSLPFYSLLDRTLSKLVPLQDRGNERERKFDSRSEAKQRGKINRGRCEVCTRDR